MENNDRHWSQQGETGPGHGRLKNYGERRSPRDFQVAVRCFKHKMCFTTSAFLSFPHWFTICSAFYSSTPKLNKLGQLALVVNPPRKPLHWGDSRELTCFKVIQTTESQWEENPVAWHVFQWYQFHRIVILPDLMKQLFLWGWYDLRS